MRHSDAHRTTPWLSGADVSTDADSMRILALTRPDGATIILASCNVQAIIDGVLSVDHATVLEPRPFLECPRKVVWRPVTTAICQVSRNIEE
jgi:hypothetical protein